MVYIFFMSYLSFSSPQKWFTFHDFQNWGTLCKGSSWLDTWNSMWMIQPLHISAYRNTENKTNDIRYCSCFPTLSLQIGSSNVKCGNLSLGMSGESYYATSEVLNLPLGVLSWPVVVNPLSWWTFKMSNQWFLFRGNVFPLYVELWMLA